MIEIVSILLTVGAGLFILWPFVSTKKIVDLADSPLVDLESRYTQALLDLESDLLGGRISDAEFRKRRESMDRWLQSLKDDIHEQSRV
jgi:hypothetical protein